MAQINLLKQNQESVINRVGFVGIISKLAMFGLVILIAIYGFRFIQSKNASKQIEQLQNKISSQKQELSQVKKRDEVFTRQAQLKELDTLISNHLYYSQLLPELAKVTLKKASYLSFKAASEGGINLSVKLPSVADLDKFLQVFDSVKLNKYFTDIKMGGISKVQEDQNTYIRVDLQLKYNEDLLKYKTVK